MTFDKSCDPFLLLYKPDYFSFTARCKILFWHLYPDSLHIYENMSEALWGKIVNPAAINTIMPPRTCQAGLGSCTHHQSQSHPNINNSENAKPTRRLSRAIPLSVTHALINWISTDKIKTMMFEQRCVCVLFLKHVGHTHI